MHNRNNTPLILEPGQQPPPSKGKIGMLVRQIPYKQLRIDTEFLPTHDKEGQPVHLTDVLAAAAAIITTALRSALSAAREEGVTLEDVMISAVAEVVAEDKVVPGQPRFGFVISGLGLRVPREDDAPDIVEVRPEMGPMPASAKVIGTMPSEEVLTDAASNILNETPPDGDLKS